MPDLALRELATECTRTAVGWATLHCLPFSIPLDRLVRKFGRRFISSSPGRVTNPIAIADLLH